MNFKIELAFIIFFFFHTRTSVVFKTEEFREELKLNIVSLRIGIVSIRTNIFQSDKRINLSVWMGNKEIINKTRHQNITNRNNLTRTSVVLQTRQHT